MPKFKRFINDLAVIQELQSSSLFQEKLLPDIKKGLVFPAIRTNSLHFYYGGSRLYDFSKDFRSHRKYIAFTKGKDYLSEAQANQIDLSVSFTKDYEEMKSSALTFSGIEANGLSKLYPKGPIPAPSENPILLDIEVSFESRSEDDTQDRIDFVLFHQKKQALMFIEGKHFSNKEIISKRGTKPKVVKQIERYKNQIVSREAEILESYSRYIENLNSIFSIELPPPIHCIPHVGLYIFGFDDNQKQGRLTEIILADGSLDGIPAYSKGDPAKISPRTIWQKLQKEIEILSF